MIAITTPPPPPPPLAVNQPAAVVVVTAKHYKMGYLECMSEAMHFLVEVQGYFAGDSLCVEMINHLRKHFDKVLKGKNRSISVSGSFVRFKLFFVVVVV